MLRRLLVLTMTLVCACVQPASAPSQAKLAAQIDRMAVALVETDEETSQPRAYCSGTWIGQDRILTASHCVKDPDPPLSILFMFGLAEVPPPPPPIGKTVYYAVHDDGDKLVMRKAQVSTFDSAMDLAILVAKAPPSHDSARLGPSPADGDACALSGSWLGYPFTFMVGTVSKTAMEEGTESPIPRKTLLVSLPANAGDSGSGIFDAQGRLIGVLQYHMRCGPGVLFGVHRDVVADFI